MVQLRSKSVQRCGFRQISWSYSFIALTFQEAGSPNSTILIEGTYVPQIMTFEDSRTTKCVSSCVSVSPCVCMPVRACGVSVLAKVSTTKMVIWYLTLFTDPKVGYFICLIMHIEELIELSLENSISDKLKVKYEQFKSISIISINTSN